MKGFQAKKKESQSRRLRKKPQCSCDRDSKIKWGWEMYDEELLQYMVPPTQPNLKTEARKKLPIMREYLKQLYVSEGFDIDVDPGFAWGLTPIRPYDFDEDQQGPEYLEDLARLAIETYNERKITLFGDVKVEKVNVSYSRCIVYYLTFTAIDLRGKINSSKVFQAQVSVDYIGGGNDMTVIFCRLQHPPRKFPPRRPTHHGVEYDHVFDVDVRDGNPIRKLPYNRTDNPDDVVDKWLYNQCLPLSYRQQIVNFIMQNGQSDFTTCPLCLDPYTDAHAYLDELLSKSSGLSEFPYKHIPKKEMLVFDVARFDGIFRTVLEKNGAMWLNQERQHLAMNQAELSRITTIIQVLKDTSHYHSSKFADIDFALMLKLLKTWPTAVLSPVINIMRMIVLHPDGASRLLQCVKDGNDIVIELIRKVTASPPLSTITRPSIHVVTNLFKNSLFHEWLQLHRAEILDAFSSCCSFWNDEVQKSYATLLLNYAVLLIEKKDEKGQSQVLSAALKMAEWEEVDTDARFHALVAIGSLILEGQLEIDLRDVFSVAEAAKVSKDLKNFEVGYELEWAAKFSCGIPLYIKERCTEV